MILDSAFTLLLLLVTAVNSEQFFFPPTKPLLGAGLPGFGPLMSPFGGSPFFDGADFPWWQFGFGGGRFGGPSGARHGRQADFNAQNDLKLVKCAISSVDKIIKCEGPSHTFSCPVVPRIDVLKSVELKIQDLDLIKREGEASILRLVVPTKQITAVNPITKEDISLVLWNNLVAAKSESLVGFEILDSECWSKVQLLTSSLKPEELSVGLIVA
jgi:hypothetical protein